MTTYPDDYTFPAEDGWREDPETGEIWRHVPPPSPDGADALAYGLSALSAPRPSRVVKVFTPLWLSINADGSLGWGGRVTYRDGI